MIGFYDYTVITTYVSLISSCIGIYFCYFNNISAAIICLAVSGLLDTFDGRIARTKKDRTDEAKSFGIQIDSLTDIVAFGILPAAISFSACKNTKYEIVTFVTFCAYVLCALIRLAYFNVTEEIRQDKETCSRHEYLGMPVTMSSVFLPLLFIINEYLSIKASISYAILLFVMALLFITPIRVKKPGTLGFIFISLLGIGAIIVLFIVI